MTATLAYFRADVGSGGTQTTPASEGVYASEDNLLHRTVRTQLSSTDSDASYDRLRLEDDGEEEDQDSLLSSELSSQTLSSTINSFSSYSPLAQVDDEWLQSATDEYLDLQLYPHGRLGSDDVQAITMLMAAWARRKGPLQVEALLKRLVDEQRSSTLSTHSIQDASQRRQPLVVATTEWYVYAMEAWARSDVPGGAQRAQVIHDTLVNMFRNYCAARKGISPSQLYSQCSLAPTLSSFNALLYAWSKASMNTSGGGSSSSIAANSNNSNNNDSVNQERQIAPVMADQALRQMIEFYEQGHEQLKPDTTSFTT
jgi:hypothetical protein